MDEANAVVQKALSGLNSFRNGDLNRAMKAVSHLEDQCRHEKDNAKKSCNGCAGGFRFGFRRRRRLLENALYKPHSQKRMGGSRPNGNGHRRKLFGFFKKLGKDIKKTFQPPDVCTKLL